MSRIISHGKPSPAQADEFLAVSSPAATNSALNAKIRNGARALASRALTDYSKLGTLQGEAQQSDEMTLYVGHKRSVNASHTHTMAGLIIEKSLICIS
jgi:hypothetical protein